MLVRRRKKLLVLALQLVSHVEQQKAALDVAVGLQPRGVGVIGRKKVAHNVVTHKRVLALGVGVDDVSRNERAQLSGVGAQGLRVGLLPAHCELAHAKEVVLPPKLLGRCVHVRKGDADNVRQDKVHKGVLANALAARNHQRDARVLRRALYHVCKVVHHVLVRRGPGRARNGTHERHEQLRDLGLLAGKHGEHALRVNGHVVQLVARGVRPAQPHLVKLLAQVVLVHDLNVRARARLKQLVREHDGLVELGVVIRVVRRAVHNAPLRVAPPHGEEGHAVHGARARYEGPLGREVLCRVLQRVHANDLGHGIHLEDQVGGLDIRVRLLKGQLHGSVLVERNAAPNRRPPTVGLLAGNGRAAPAGRPPRALALADHL